LIADINHVTDRTVDRQAPGVIERRIVAAIEHTVIGNDHAYRRVELTEAAQVPVLALVPCSHRRSQPADLDSAGRLRASTGVRRSGTNADDRLPLASFGRV